MTSRKLAFALVFCLISAAQAASAVKDLKARSDAVVIARTAQWTLQDSVIRVVLTVEASVFGPLQPNSVVNASFELRTPSSSRTAPEALPRGLWFLKQEESGWFITSAIPDKFASIKNLFIPLVEGALADPSEPLSDKALTIAAARGLLASGMHPFLWRYVLGREDSPEIRKLLWEFVAAPDTPTHVVGLTQLLNLGDVDALRSLREPRDFSNERNSEGLTLSAANAVSGFFRNAAPDAIQLLGEFSNDATLPANLREAAAMALSAMHPPESLPYLAKLLDDPNQELRARGSIGISLFANGMGAQDPSGGPSMPHLNNPSPSAYRTMETANYVGFDPTRETEFIAFWKSWWLEHQFDFQ